MSKEYFLRQDIDLTDYKPMFFHLENNNRLHMNASTTGHYGYLQFDSVGDEVDYKKITLYNSYHRTFNVQNIVLEEEYRFNINRDTGEFIYPHMVLEVKYSLELTKTKEQDVQTDNLITTNDDTINNKKVAEENNNSSFSQLNHFMTILNDALEAEEYFDITFLTSDNKNVRGHQCILHKQSELFASLFKEQTEIPVYFPHDVVSQAIKFCYGKHDAICGFEMVLIRFAEEYKVDELRKACIQSLPNIVLTVENICSVIKMAVDENMDNLKKRCIQFLKENKSGIDKKLFDSLPHEVLVEIIVTI